MTALADLLTPADRQRLLEHLADADQMDCMHAGSVTALPVTLSGSQGGLTAPARAVPPVRPAGDRAAAPGASPCCGPGEPLFHLPPQPPDRRLGFAQFGDHPRLDGHLVTEALEVDSAAGEDGVSEPLLGGVRGHVTTISVTPEPYATALRTTT